MMDQNAKPALSPLVYRKPKPKKGSLHLVRLSITAFLCGTMVMVLEMTGSRMLAPYLGTSIIVWTSLIGVVLASLSFGYWYGGILADDNPSEKRLARIIFIAAIVIAVVGFSYNYVLRPFSIGQVNLYFASVISSLILFAVPGALLGMVSPFVVRLAVSEVSSTGTIVGRLYALSSLGSILGTFLGGFLLISVMKTGTILFLIATILVLLALIVQGKKPVFPNYSISAVLVPLFLFGGGWYEVHGNELLPSGEHWDSPYNHIRVYEMHKQLRVLQTSPGSASQSVMIMDRPNDIASRYVQFYELGFHFHPNVERLLVIGGGGYCIPKHVLTHRENVNIDVVEIDPKITEIARKWFALSDEMVESPRLNIFHEDARQFLRRKSGEKDAKKYDIVFGDAFNSDYNIPFHLTTREYMEEVSDQLSDRGIFITNIISSVKGKKHKLLEGFYAALDEVFPQVAVFLVGDPKDEKMVQNIVLVGFKEPCDLGVRMDTPLEIINLLGFMYHKDIHPKVPPLTDAFAPVERYVLE